MHTKEPAGRGGHHRRAAQALLDALAWAAAVVLTTRRPPSLSVDRVSWGAVGVMVAVAVALALALGIAFGLYSGRWHFGSFEEVAVVVPAVVMTGAVLVLLNGFVLQLAPVGASLFAPPLALILHFGTRYVWRLHIETGRRPDGARAERLLIYGAGPAGTQVVRLMMSTPDADFVPVAFVDDDSRKHRWRVKGVPVAGGREDLGAIAQRYAADAVLIAIPSASSAVIRELADVVEAAGLPLYVLPGVRELVTGRASLQDIRELNEVDLLGRAVIDTDVTSIADYVAGKTVLVTGAGGSIGSELCRQLVKFHPAQLVMLDRDESALHAVQLSMEGRALLDSGNLVVADLRDGARMAQVLGQYRPQVVFHAAALKHLTLLELHPAEAVKTNVWGTLTLLELADAFGVETLVNISTDKAADPVSVLGYSKRIAERSTSDVAARSGRRYLSVRFGNVVGSRGSVLVTFRSQIANGDPVTVTHPDVTRFFMTIEEAVQLVIQAGALGAAGEVLVLDMGEPVNIADLARRLVRASGKDLDVVFTGLRPGEKLHESLVGQSETASRSCHPLILHASVPPVPADEVRGIDIAAPDLIELLSALCEERVDVPRPRPRPRTNVLVLP